MTPDEERKVLDAAETFNGIATGAVIGIFLVVGYLVVAFILTSI